MTYKMQLNVIAPATVEQLTNQINLIDAWLTSPVVFSNGAIAGSIDSSGLALYTYPEISGYYLSYLAYRFDVDGFSEQLAEKAKKILAYQKRIWSESAPPATRLYLHSNAEAKIDWRNQGLFIFDIAMLARGITDISRYVDSDPWSHSLLFPHIDTFFEPGHLNPVRWFLGRPDTAPDRWSTRVGVYQLKVMAALQRAADVWNDVRLQDKIIPIQSELTQRFNKGDFASHNPHSVAYAIEGALLLMDVDSIDWALSDEWLEKLVFSMDANAPVDIDCRRADVIAQLLRLSCCEPFFNASRADKLYALLMSALNNDGSFQFTLPPFTVTYKNTWTALFARQALGFYRSICLSGMPIPNKEARCLF